MKMVRHWCHWLASIVGDAACVYAILTVTLVTQMRFMLFMKTIIDKQAT